MGYDPILLEASRLGFIAELNGRRLVIETPDGVVVVGPRSPVTLEVGGGGYRIGSPLGSLETGEPRLAVAAAYAFYAGWTFNRIASKVRVLGGILSTTPVGGECSRWASRLSELEGRKACVLAILVAAGYRAFESANIEGSWRNTEWARAAALIDDGLSRLSDESRLADRIVEVLRETEAKWIHAFPLLSIATTILGHPRLDYLQAIAHPIYEARISSIRAPGPLEVLYATQPSWVSGKTLSTQSILAKGLVLAASSPITLPAATDGGDATVYVDRIALHRALSLGRMAWQTYESARLHGSPAALYRTGPKPVLGVAGLAGIVGEYCVEPRLPLPVGGLVPGEVRECAIVKPSAPHGTRRGGR